MRALLLACALIIGFAAPAAAQTPAPHAEANPFADWAGFFIAGDFRAQSGAPSEVFDNGRREMAEAFERVGIPKANIRQFSVRPHRYPDEKPLASEPDPISTSMVELTGKTKGGCLFFFTSHGNPDMVVMGEYAVRPAEFARLIDATCGDRPTVAIISACFSGVFVPALSGPNRIVMTAARPDRSSFGCGENNEYTFFDECVLQGLETAIDFEALAARAKACVSVKETELKLTPPSEPQVAIGAQFKFQLPLLRLDRGRAPRT